jgi:hypothetical protein
MAIQAPPPAVDRLDPELLAVPAGTTLWRVHLDRFPALFNSKPVVEPFGGGRFDSNQLNRYPFCYLAYEQDTAVCERLLRSVPFSDRGTDRLLPHSAVAGRTLRAVHTTADLALLSLRSTQALAKVYADEWLVQADPLEYPYTRGWAHWLRPRVLDADGFVWPSRRNLGTVAVILFGDRCQTAVDWHPNEPVIHLDGADGLKALNQRLAPYRLTVAPQATPGRRRRLLPPLRSGVPRSGR